MKKLVLAVMTLVAIPTLVLAQGTINFGTTSPGTQQIFKANGTTVADPGQEVSLWWSSTQLGTYTQIAINNVTVNGWLTTPVLATTGLATAEGASAWFYLYASDGAFYGQTPSFLNATGAPNGNPPTNAQTLDGWTSPIVMSTPLIPEPSTMALAGLGIAALLAYRRRS